MDKQELDRLAHSMAFEFSESVITSEGFPVSDEHGDRWYQVDTDGAVDLFDGVRYLDARGLLERHHKHRDWVRAFERSTSRRRFANGCDHHQRMGRDYLRGYRRLLYVAGKPLRRVEKKGRQVMEMPITKKRVDMAVVVMKEVIAHLEAVNCFSTNEPLYTAVSFLEAYNRTFPPPSKPKGGK